MCGYIGTIGSDVINHQLINEMASSIEKRGPDDKGIFIDNNYKLAIAHQRLSILDLSYAGHQPMTSNNKRFVIAYNGEIYNHLEIRKYLDDKKISNQINWQGHSDTETLLESIAAIGLEKTLAKIEGMFSFALWDKKLKKLYLVKDRLGEKPLYYGFNKGVFYFGSDLKSFKKSPIFEPEIDNNSLALLIKYNFIPAPSSIYKNIYKLEPGKYLTFSTEKNDYILKTYWNVFDNINQNNPVNNKSDSDYIEELDELLNQKVSDQMNSDVPIGSFLSGGIDSSLISSLMQKNSLNKIETFSIGFDDSDYDEARYAKRIANHLGTNHNEYYLSSKKSLEIIPNLSSIYSEPFADSSQIPTFLVCNIAKTKVKVVLGGDGGDELFGGYNRYVLGRRMWSRISHLPLNLRQNLSSLIGSISPEKYNFFFNTIFGFLPLKSTYSNIGDKLHKGARVMIANNEEELYNLFISHWINPNEIVNLSKEGLKNKIRFPDNKLIQDPIFKMMISDLIYYLPDDILCKVDRAAMDNSLETRLPILNHEVVKFALNLPHKLKFRKNVGKWILREVLSKYLPRKLIERPKMGFGIPIGSWLRGPLNMWAEDLLNEKLIKEQGFFNYENINHCWKMHKSGKKNMATSLWSILMFQEWLAKQ